MSGQGEQRKNVRVKDFLQDHLSKLEKAVARDSEGKAIVDVQRAVTLFGLEAAENPDLERCYHLSVLKCLMSTVAMGLEPGRDVHFIPRQEYENRQPTGYFYCTIIVDYKGLLAIALRSGNIRKIEARVVFDDEVRAGRFRYRAGDDERIDHEPILDSKEHAPPNVYAAYAIATLSNGEKVRDVLTRAELAAISDNSHGNLWNDPYTGLEMARKSAVRRLFKYLPFPSELKQAVSEAESVIDQSGQWASPAAIAGELPEALPTVTFTPPAKTEPVSAAAKVAGAATVAAQRMRQDQPPSAPSDAPPASRRPPARPTPDFITVPEADIPF